MNRSKLVIYALESLAQRDRIDIQRYETMFAENGHNLPQQDLEWLNFHRKRLGKIMNTINDISTGKVKI